MTHTDLVPNSPRHSTKRHQLENSLEIGGLQNSDTSLSLAAQSMPGRSALESGKVLQERWVCC